MAQNALARTSGINVGTINRVERGERLPTCPDQVRAIARALGLGPGDTDRLMVASGFPPCEARAAAMRRWAKWRR